MANYVICSACKSKIDPDATICLHCKTPQDPALNKFATNTAEALVNAPKHVSFYLFMTPIVGIFFIWPIIGLTLDFTAWYVDILLSLVISFFLLRWSFQKYPHLWGGSKWKWHQDDQSKD
jgi:hypothetical protein